MKALNVRFNAPKVEAKLADLVDRSDLSGEPTVTRSQLARAAMNIGLAMLPVAQSSMTASEFSRYIDGEQ